MNEEALLDLYEMAANDGYTGSLEAFSNLIKTNDEAVNDLFEMAQGDGYTDSIDDFKTLVGAVELSPPTQPAGRAEVFFRGIENHKRLSN